MTNADAPDNITRRSNIDRPKRLMKIQISNERVFQVDAILRNVTEGGAGIELQTNLEKGETVLITIQGLEPFFGTVAWAKQHRAGLEFEEPIDPSLLTIKNRKLVEGEGIFNGANGYHVFDRFVPVSDFKRPMVKSRT